MTRSDTAARTRDQILEIIKRDGPQGVRPLAERLGVTEMAVRQHLQGLEGAGLVSPHTRQRTVGRPATLWGLTDTAQSRFPDTHRDLALELIADVKGSLGEQAFDRLLALRADRQIASYKEGLGNARSLKARAARLAKLRSQEGYMAEVAEDTDGTLLLVENNCPICAAARACSGLCRQELEVFQAVLGDGVRVERTDHILAGARRCAYRLTPL